MFPRFPLFVPGNRPDRFLNAAKSGADAVILDLEDAVATPDKDAARNAVESRKALPVPTVVRVNAPGSEAFDADIAMLLRAPPDAVMLPKASDPTQAARLHEKLAGRSALIVLIESAEGIGRLSELLTVTGVVGAAFGHLDYAVDLGCAPDWEPLLTARSALVLQSRIARLPAPLDGVTANIADPAATATDAARAKSLGFGGKLLIHPRQVAEAQNAMKYSEAERKWAEGVVDASKGDGAVQLAGEMIDPPVLARARAILRG
jgi:citrate lyase subunit beta/citryl-CoA lyase